MKLLHRISIFICALLLGACESPQTIGGRMFPVDVSIMLDGSPLKGAKVYFIPAQDWYGRGMTETDAKIFSSLSAYEQPGNLSPCTIRVSSYRHVVLVKWQGRIWRYATEVSPSVQTTVLIELSSKDAAL